MCCALIFPILVPMVMWCYKIVSSRFLKSNSNNYQFLPMSHLILWRHHAGSRRLLTHNTVHHLTSHSQSTMSSFLRFGKGGLGRRNEKRKRNSDGPCCHLCHKCGKPFTEEWSLRGHLSRCQVENDHTVTQTYTRSAMIIFANDQRTTAQSRC